MRRTTFGRRLATRTTLALALVAMFARPAFAAPAEYRLGYGDTITVTVVGQPSLSVEDQPVRPDGGISLPMIKQLRVEGRSVQDLTEALTAAYRPYVTTPQVIVKVMKFRPLRVTLLGQVGRPGSFAFEHAPTLADALATAGGLTNRAARARIKVVEAGGKTTVYDLERFTSGQAPFPRIADGSVIEVEEVWGPDLMPFLPFIASIVTAGVILLR